MLVLYTEGLTSISCTQSISMISALIRSTQYLHKTIIISVVDCVEPPIVDNATLAIDPGYYTFGANLKHECDIGYEQDSKYMDILFW